MKLYCFPETSNNVKVLAVVRHLGLTVAIQRVDLVKREQFSPAYLALNPNHMTPTLVDGDFVLWESNAIMQYLAAKVPGTSLWPAAPKARADVSRWQCWQLAHWDGQACRVLAFERLIKGLAGDRPDPAVVAKADAAFHRCAAVLDGHLAGRQWLVGEDVTLADFAVAAPLVHAAAAELPLEDYTEIRRWYGRVAGLDAWQQATRTMA